jgi:hypothetical protein
MHRKADSSERKGAVAPFVAILSVVLLAMVAFAVDIGWVVLTNNHLQNAADAAALAGSDALMDGYLNYSLAGTDDKKREVVKIYFTEARDKAKAFAKYNAAGGVKDLTLRDQDIEFGFMDAKYNYSSLGTYNSFFKSGDDDEDDGGSSHVTKLPSQFPNTIKIVVRRDGNANGSLSLFFARVIGSSEVNLTATASATAMGVDMNSVPTGIGMLPMTYDVHAWDNFVKTGKDPDGKTSTAYNGFPHLQVYPSVKDTGNFGQLSLDGAHSGASETSNWIHNGVSAADVKSLQSLNLIPLSNGVNKCDWIGNPGFKASTVMDVNEYTAKGLSSGEGKIFALPLFEPYQQGTNSGKGGGKKSSSTSYEAGTGNGSHYYYNIVRFVGIRITSDYRDNRVIMVQPAAFIDPFATPSGPAGTQTGTPPITTFTTPRLTR